MATSGRYNLGLDEVLPQHAWPALYLGLSQAICIGEVLRHLAPKTMEKLGFYRITELWAETEAVLDCRDPSVVGLTIDDVCDDLDYTVPTRCLVDWRAPRWRWGRRAFSCLLPRIWWTPSA